MIIAIVIEVFIFAESPEKKKIKYVVEILPFLVYVTVLFNTVFLLIARFLGLELVSLGAAAISMIIVLATTRKGFLVPKNIWTFSSKTSSESPNRDPIFTPRLIIKLQETLEKLFEKEYSQLDQEIDVLNREKQAQIAEILKDENTQLHILNDEVNDYWKRQSLIKKLKRKDFLLGVPIVRAWIPYIMIGAILALTRVLATLRPESWAGVMKNIKLVIPDGSGGVFWSFAFLWNPGVVFILVALLSIIILRMRKVYVKKAWVKSFDQVRGAAVPLLFGVAMVYVFRNSANSSIEAAYLMSGKSEGLGSMLTMMADGLGYLFKDFYLWISPVIGIVGAFISGSNTVSNTLFAGLQFETAVLVGLPQVIIIALQNTGGAIGNMICVNNVISACATAGISGKEGKIIRMNLVPCLLYWLLLSVSALFIAGTFF